MAVGWDALLQLCVPELATAEEMQFVFDHEPFTLLHMSCCRTGRSPIVFSVLRELPHLIVLTLILTCAR